MTEASAVVLRDIEPDPISSTLRRNWWADAPPWIVGGIVAGPALFLSAPLQYIVLGIGAAVGIGTDVALSLLRAKWRISAAKTPPTEYPAPIEFDRLQRADVWQSLTADPAIRALVLFSYGTCVVSVDDVEDPVANAREILSNCGHSIPGTPSADMFVYNLPDSGDFVVGCYHPNILTYVSRDVFDSNATADDVLTAAAFLGREFRCLDTFAQDVVHVVRLPGR